MNYNMLTKEQRLKSKSIRTAIAGTGYIADFHARAIRAGRDLKLVGVCDGRIEKAESFARKWQVAAVFDSFDSMLRSERPDSVHLLTPPDTHYPLAKVALESGVHVFVEKPMCLSTDQADELVALARRKNLRLAVGHNMLFATPYQRLREVVHTGMLGPLDHIIINHFLELGQIRLGPFDSWVLQNPGNVVLEIGPHLFSALLDLLGKPHTLSASAGRHVALPGGLEAFRRWNVRASVGPTVVDINMELGPGFGQRTIDVHGLFGSASLNFETNTCTVNLASALSLDLERYQQSKSAAKQIRSQARKTFADYALSIFKLRARGNPYQVTFLDSIDAFYTSLRSGTPLDARIDGFSGREVIELCTKTIRAVNIDPAKVSNPRPRVTVANRPTILVIGGTGFIGRELIAQLIAAQLSVRVMARTSAAVLEGFDRKYLEIVRGDTRNQADLMAAMQGIEFVYHLASAQAKTWEEQLRNEVEPVRLIGKACLAAGVKRLIYTGTIDSYYAGSAADTITEDTPLDSRIAHRNYYARAKAAAEGILTEMHRVENLPVVIFRPGIVIGKGGTPFHFGVGRWTSNYICEVWGDGRNSLPFVLVSDVAAALVRGIQVKGVEGRSYNLIDTPLLTARDYLGEFQKRAGMRLKVHYRPTWQYYAEDFTKWAVKVATHHPDRARIPSYHDWQSRTQKASFDSTRARIELNWAPASNPDRLREEGIGGSLHSWLTSLR